jgi:hypothetical protein
MTSAVNATNSKLFELKSLKTPTNLRRVQMPKIANISAASYHPLPVRLENELNQPAVSAFVDWARPPIARQCRLRLGFVADEAADAAG